MARVSSYSSGFRFARPSLYDATSIPIMDTSNSSSLAIDLNCYDQAIHDLTEALKEVKITAALALQESQLVREQMQQGIMSILSELTSMWYQDMGLPEIPSSPTEGADSGASISGSEDQRVNFRYKTQLCKNFMSGGVGYCARGETCQFAHGEHELRQIYEHPRYKTKMCTLQLSLGKCPHGPSCFFAHKASELRVRDF